MRQVESQTITKDERQCTELGEDREQSGRDEKRIDNKKNYKKQENGCNQKQNAIIQTRKTEKDEEVSIRKYVKKTQVKINQNVK